MARTQYTGPRMPKAMNALINGNAPGKKPNKPQSRTERRKFERQQKKSARAPQKSKPHGGPTGIFRSAESEVPRKVTTPKAPASEPEEVSEDDIPEEDLSESEPSDVESDSEEISDSKSVSKTVRDRLAKDDAEIAALEKKLGIKKKKGKKEDPFDDGLEDLFGDLGDFDEDEVSESLTKPKRKLAEDEEWLRQKRRKVEAEDSDFGGFHDSEDQQDLSGDDEVDDEEDDASDFDDDFGSGSESEDPETVKQASTSTQKTRENPYVAPTTDAQPPVAAGKYIPPSLRKAATTADESVIRLNRQIQGLINRLAEANLISIVQSVEGLYATNARQHVTSGIIETLLSLLGASSVLTDTFLVLHGAFIAALYRLVGIDFGAQLLERIVDILDDPTNSESKKPVNLVSLLAVMYSLQVTSCDIMYDLIRHFTKRFTEDDTELLLRIVRLCGPQLKQDDPSALKDVVSMMQSTAAERTAGSLSVRQSFMIETINDLKNNRMKTGMAASATRTETLARMKKMLGTVKSKSSKASEPLRISLDDIRSSDKKGKWWLVGASYHDPAKMADNAVPNHPSSNDKNGLNGTNGTLKTDADDVDYHELARRHGMNTDIRRSIFVAIMSAVDFKHAVIQITKLNLKKNQMEEIPSILVRCALAESPYNPYYALVAGELCPKHRQVAMAFRFVLWDHFKRMDEQDDDDGSEQERLELEEIVKLATFYARLVRLQAVPISVLKKVDFLNVQANTNVFLQILITSVITGKTKLRDGVSCEQILADVADAPDMVTGYRYFLQHAVADSQVVEKKKHKQKVAEVCERVVALLSQAAV